jgi:hypothetical protein
MADRDGIDTGRRSIRAPRFPDHVVALIGVSTAGYALAVAGIASLQARADTEKVANQAPVVAGIEAIAAGNQRLSGRLDALSERDTTSTSAYGTLAAGITGLERDLGALADTVSRVDGAARHLPTSVALPPTIRSVRPATRTPSHATTGASGVP